VQKEEKFFSKAVTHIITTRQIPTEDTASVASGQDDQSQATSTSALDKAARQRKDGAPALDILQRGLQMGMKIWAAEKLQRVLSTMEQKSTAVPAREVVRDHNDLSQALRNDRVVTSERERPGLQRDLVPFKGPYIYIHDMDERYRPTMAREYKQPAKKGDGEWPQFRSAAVGKCPFIEDPQLKKDQERKAAQQRALQREEPTRMQPPRRVSPRKSLRELHNPPPATINPSMLHKRTDSTNSFPPLPSQNGMDFVRAPGGPLLMTREPAASGIQRSNLTSAIQSNMISSTAATGVKTNTSKEVNELKRKVLERSNTGSASVGSIPSSHRMQDLAGVLKNARAPAPARAAKSKAQEKLGGIQEDEEEEYLRQRATKASRKRSQREPKPGYCENCRDKYEDFDEVSSLRLLP
jgi:regulatory subunit for Cdc7p protein kinase